MDLAVLAMKIHHRRGAGSKGQQQMMDSAVSAMKIRQ